jgi:hypothetical protein
MRSLVVLFGLLLTGAALAADCRQPSTPDFPANILIGGRAEKKLSRDLARYIADSTKYIGCLRTDASADPSAVAQKEYATIWAVEGLIDLYETRVGHSDELIAAIARMAGPADRSALDGRIAAAQRVLDSDAITTLNVAVTDSNAGRYAESRVAIGELDFERLSRYERSKAEQILYTVSYMEGNYVEAREHVRKSIDAGGLSRPEMFNAHLALVNIDVMLRLSVTNSERTADQPVE